jgi:hypothetical protein
MKFLPPVSPILLLFSFDFTILILKYDLVLYFCVRFDFVCQIQYSPSSPSISYSSARRRKISVIRHQPLTLAIHSPATLVPFHAGGVGGGGVTISGPTSTVVVSSSQQSSPYQFPLYQDTLLSSSLSQDATEMMRVLEERSVLRDEPSSSVPNPNSSLGEKRSGSFSSLLLPSSRETTSRSVADLPSKLNLIFASKERNLCSMKSLAKSCADLRRLNSDDTASPPLGSPRTPSNLLLSPTSRFNFDGQDDNNSLGSNPSSPPKAHQIPSDYLLSYGKDNGKTHYQTIHSSVPSSDHPQSPPSANSYFERPNFLRTMGSLSLNRAMRKKDSSISDSDEEYNNNYSRNNSPPPGRIMSPTKGSSKYLPNLQDDPMLLLKTKLKHTHSLINLPAVLQKESAAAAAESSLSSMQRLFNLKGDLSNRTIREVPTNYYEEAPEVPLGASVYHTVHGGASGSGLFGSKLRTNQYNLDQMEMGLFSGGGGGGDPQSDSTVSSGYKTVGPYYSQGGYEDNVGGSSALSRFLKEKQRSRLLDDHYHYLVRTQRANEHGEKEEE